MDEEELQKRFTDCVYFLASPLTCKKGIECEYRHSEIARLNPRDCWYWLGGCCYNPECAFRHPPLDGLKEAYSESSKPNSGPALPVDNTNIPCYFYLKGFCNKGDRCSFLHGSADGTIASKSSKAVPCEKKLSARSNTGSPPVENHPNPSEIAQIENTVTESKGAQHAQKLASESPEISESPDISDSLLLQEEFVHSESDHINDQNSDQQAVEYVEREGWLESSPGFDVLVEGESEHLGYEGSELDVHYADYDHTDPIEYDPAYPDLGYPLSEERYDVYDVGKISGKSRESIFCRLSFQKHNLQVEPIFNGRRGSDLREHLKKRKLYDSPCLVDHRISRYTRRHGSRGEIDIDHRGRLRKSVPMSRYRQPLKDKRPGKPHFLFSEVSRSRKPALQQKRKPRDESAIFTGPKTLDQIKEEKKKALQTVDLSGKSYGFQGPRPLSEILKNKRKLG